MTHNYSCGFAALDLFIDSAVFSMRPWPEWSQRHLPSSEKIQTMIRLGNLGLDFTAKRPGAHWALSGLQCHQACADALRLSDGMCISYMISQYASSFADN